METKRLYKYQAGREEQIISLLDSKVFFSERKALNDPLDCTPSIKWCDRKEFESMYESLLLSKSTGLDSEAQDFLSNSRIIETLYDTYADPEHFGSFLAHQSNFIGLLSLSETPANELMWSHYAMGHRGYCVGFELEYNDELMFVPSDSFKECEARLLRVDYSRQPIGFDYSFYALAGMYLNSFRVRKGRLLTPNDVVEALSFRRFSGFFFEHFSSIFFSRKTPPWSYEKEYRMVSLPRGSSAIGLKKLRARESIKEVTFGCRSSSELQQRIKKGLHGLGIEFYIATLDGGSSLVRQRIL